MGQLAVAIKGYSRGLRIVIEPGASMDDIIKGIDDKLEKNAAFFQGVKPVIQVIGAELNFMDKHKLATEIDKVIEYSDMEFDDEQAKKNDKADDNWEYFEGIEEGNTKFVEKLIRSGQTIYYPGNLVVLGDVNPGAELIAGGNIIVIGTLAGLAHAGATGNDNAYLIAFKMCPSQIRISDRLLRLNRDISDNQEPEKAYIEDGKLQLATCVGHRRDKTSHWLSGKWKTHKK